MSEDSEGAARGGAASPYKGLGYYAERDAPFFFGREHETSIIAANLVAVRLTLLYGASGVGKSSLLRAGVARRLREQARESLRAAGTPGAVVVVFPADDEEGGARQNSWRDDPLVEIPAAVEAAVADLGIDVDPVDRSLPLATLLETWCERLGADLLLILDQFEEFFLYHGNDRGPGTYFDELPRVLTREGVGANVLISIREDAYSKLDTFKGRIPSLYDNYLRVNHLDRNAARSAIERPIEEYNRLVAATGDGVTIEPELVDAVLEDVQTGQLVLGQSGAGSVLAPDGGDARIETPFLQLVLERLWNEEVGSGSQALRLETLERLGGAERIVRTHLDDAMASLADEEKEIAARAFRQLVTPSGTKIAHLPSDLAALEDAPQDRLAVVLERLAAARIVRPIAPPLGQTDPRYEIFHDVLAPAVLDWRARYLQERAERVRELRRRRLLIVWGSILGVLLVAALAVGITVVDSLNDRTNEAEDAAFLNEARAADGFAGVFVAREPLAEAIFAPDGRHVLTAAEDGTLGIWSTGGAAGPKGGKLLRTLRDRELQTAAYAPSGRSILVTGSDGVAVWSLAGGKRREVTNAPAADAAFSHDGKLIAIAGVDGTASVVTWPGLRRFASFSAPRQSALRSIDFSPDGRSVATASDDGYARVWDLAVGSSPKAFRASRVGSAYSVAFSSTGRFLVTGGQDGTAAVWEIGSRRRLQILDAGAESVVDARFSPSEKFLVTASGTAARVWLWSPPRLALDFVGNTDAVRSATFNGTGTLVLTAGRDGTGRLWGVALPDLTVELATVEPEPDGRSLRATFNVTNAGGGAAVATSVLLSSPGFRPVSVAVPSLRPGGVYPVEANLRIPAPARGTDARIRVTVNPEKRVIEADYANNAEARSIMIEAPDLALETTAVTPSGGGRQIVTVEVRNEGRGPAEATTVVSRPTGYYAAFIQVPPLAAGRRTELKLLLQPRPGAPAQQAELTVDPAGTTGDRNRQNNSDLTQPLPAFGG